jgi:protein O-GlcNAc transferase
MQFGLSASLFNTAYEHHQAGRVAEADHACRQALGIDPKNADALHLLGVIAGQTGFHQDSLALIDQALAVSPKFAEAHANRGVALMALGRGSEAVDAFQQSARLKPDHVMAHYGLGNALGNQGDLDGAVKAFRQALAIAPNFVEAQNNLAMALQQQDKLDEALEGFRKAVAMSAPSAQLQYNLGVTLHQSGLPHEAVGAFEAALALNPAHGQAHSNLLLARNYLPGSAEALIDAHRDFDRRHGRPLRPTAPTWRNQIDPDRRLRIGYLSGDFSTHPVGYLLAGPLAAHDAAQVEVFCYSNGSRPDAMTERLRACAHHWRDIGGRSDGTVSPLIREDEIDILVDLSGHTDKNRPLALARRAAPIQVSWLGYPGTTGLEAIDYAIMDPVVAPDGAEAWFTETLVRLPHSRFCYSPPEFAPEPRDAPDRGGASVVFGSFNNLAKIGLEVVALWARVLDAVPGSRLVLKWKALDQAGVRQRLTQAFAAHGVGPDRLELRERSAHAQMLAEYGDIDVALDPFPYGGGATSAEALWMGVPVVTLPSDRVAARQTLGFLAELDLQDLAAASLDDYVRIASALAADPARRGELRRSLRARMQASPLVDAKAFTPGLEQAYRQMWRRWCEGLPPAAMTIA